MSAARILCKYQDGDKSKKFVVKAGFMEGKVMDAAETNAIAKLPKMCIRDRPATVETGAEIRVPLFINEGDHIRIDTRTGEYMERV